MTSTLAAMLITAVTALSPLAQTSSGLAIPTEGRVVVECLVAPEGALTDCLVVEETPSATAWARVRWRLPPS